MNDASTGIRRALRWAGGTFAVMVLLLAVLFSLFRLVVPAVPQYRGEIEQWASEVLGAPVEITDMDLRWRGLRPEVVFGSVRYVAADARIALAVRELRIGLSYRSLFRAQRLAPARIVLVDPDFTWVMAAELPEASPAAAWIDALSREERHGELVISNGRVTVYTDDGRQFPFTGIDGRAASDGRNHRLHLDVAASGVLGHTLTVEAVASGMPRTDAWIANIHVDAQRVDLAALQALAGHPGLKQGRLDFGLALEIAGSEAVSMKLDLGLAGLAWASAGTGQPRGVDRAAADVEWRRIEGGWRATINRFDVSRSTGVTENGLLTLEFLEPATPSDLAFWRLHGDGLWLQDFAMLALVVPVRAGDTARWHALEPHGKVNAVDLMLRRAPGQAARWSIEATGERLAWQSVSGARIPGINGLDAAIDGNGESGRALLSGEVHAEFPWLMPDALRPLDIDARLEWQREGDRLRFSVPEFVARNDDIENLRGQGELVWPGQREGATLDLAADFENIDLGSGRAYLPERIMPPAVVGWLERAVAGGTATGGRFEARGPVAGFPYRDGGGLFHTAFDARDIALDYAESWPSFRDGEAHVEFFSNGFAAEVSDGWVAGVKVREATVVIGDFREPELRIDGALGDELEMLRLGFLATPPGSAMGDWLAYGESEGYGRLEVVVAVPLRDVASTRVGGVLDLCEASFKPGGLTHNLSGITGTLHIDDTAVTADGISARVYDAPLRIAVEERDVDSMRTTLVRFNGSVDRELAAAFGIGIPDDVVDGAAGIEAVLRIPREGGEALDLTLHSDLYGLSLDLPTPLGKSRDDTWDASAGISLTPEQRVLHVRIPNRLQVEGKLRETSQGWKTAAGSVHVGVGERRALPESGVVLTGWLDMWRFGQLRTLTETYAGLEIHAIDMEFGELEALGQSLGNAHVDASRQRAAWRLQLDGERISGEVLLPDEPGPTSPLRLTLSRLHLERALLRGNDGVTADPRAIPAAVFHIGDFSTGAVALGEVNGQLRPVSDGVALDAFTATAPTQRIAIEGSWLTDGNYHSTTVRGTVDSTDVRKTLASLGYTASIEAAAGHLDGEVSWPDMPHGEIFEGLDGRLLVRIERGTLLEVAPGPGRVFGLLSLNALPRRLALDFSDVFRRGLSFDSIRGNFDIERGQAYTDDLALSGPAARIEVSGRTGLATRDYDQLAVATGSLASSLTLAGTLAGGPGVGAALLIASELLRAPLEDMARVRYRIHGSWEDPRVERLESQTR